MVNVASQILSQMFGFPVPVQDSPNLLERIPVMEGDWMNQLHRGASQGGLPPLVNPPVEQRNKDLVTPSQVREPRAYVNPMSEMFPYYEEFPIQEQTPLDLSSPIMDKIGPILHDMFVGSKDDEIGAFQPVWDKGKTRKEISDEGSVLDSAIHSERFTDVGGAFKHRELFKKYPHLKKMDLQLFTGELAREPFGGSHQPYVNRESQGLVDLYPEIRVSQQMPKDAHSTMLHELQHAIQEKEGWARGGSPEQFRDENISSVNEAERNLNAYIYEREALTEGQLKGDYQYQKLLNDYKIAKLQQDAPHMQYERLAGEIEARDTQARQGMSQDERMRSQPYASQGIPASDVIVRHLSGPSASITPEQAGKDDTISQGGTYEKLKGNIPGYEEKDFGSGSAEIKGIAIQAESDIRRKAASLPQQGIVTTGQVLDWFHQNNIDTSAFEKQLSKENRPTPDQILEQIVHTPDFFNKSIFDRARIMAEAERPLRENIYPSKQSVPTSGNLKTKEDPKEPGYIKGRPIKAMDTIKGCTNKCISCYSLKGAAQQQTAHGCPVPSKLEGELDKGYILRFGEHGDPATDWTHSDKEVSALFDRSNEKAKRKNKEGVTPKGDSFVITKLQKLSGYNPETFPNLEVSADPFYPEDMIHTLAGAIALKQQYGDKVNIVLRVRSFESKNPDLQDSLQTAIDIANENNIKVLETKMRFTNLGQMAALELDDSKYKREGPQRKLKSPALKNKVKAGNHAVCDEGETGKCQNCRNCEKLMFGSVKK